MIGVDNNVQGALLVAVLMAAVAATASAQQSERGDRVIHRYFDAGQWFDESGGETQSDGDRGDAPRRRAHQPSPGDGDAPGLWLSPGEGEWIWTGDGPIGPGDVEEPHGNLDAGGAETQLDGETDQVDQLDYQASFDPSVVPFKRVGVQNRVRRHADGQYAAYLDAGSYRPVDVGGPQGTGERFWGSFLLDVDSRDYRPIPSISPQQQVVSIQTEPDVDVELARDDADNFYLRTDFEGLVRVNLELIVDDFYFGGAIDHSVRWEQFEGVQRFDEPMMRRAAQVHALIGIDRDEMSPAQVLNRLVEYHREFEARPSPETGGDRYLEISEERVGVCRHRGLTFLISAQAIGFDVRYVYNEAHAFVEVHWPGQGWRRIDLGGVADEFSYQNDGGGDVHDGLWDGEFPRPDNYEEELAAMGSDDAVEVDGEQVEADDAGDDVEVASGDTGTDDKEVEILEVDGPMLRGETVEIRGRLQSRQPGATVEILLVPAGARTFEQAISVGEGVSDDAGYISGDWDVPSDAGLGRWRLEGRIVEP